MTASPYLMSAGKAQLQCSLLQQHQCRLRYFPYSWNCERVAFSQIAGGRQRLSSFISISQRTDEFHRAHEKCIGELASEMEFLLRRRTAGKLIAFQGHRNCHVGMRPTHASSDASGDNAAIVQRRAILWAAGIPLIFPVLPATAEGGNQLLRGLGIGDPDIYYPEIFEGTWDCASTLISVETPQGEDLSDSRSVDFARKQLGFTVQYQARFMPFHGRIVGDRLFTTQSLAESTVGKDVVTSGEWVPEKPNVLVLTLKGGIKVENLVTKRSFDASGPGRFDTSEYSKQVFDNTRYLDGPPSVKASRNVTRYRWDPKQKHVMEIEAFQRIAMFPVEGGRAGNRPGGLSFMDVLSLNMGDKPTTVYKYLVRFRRRPDPSSSPEYSTFDGQKA